MDRLEAYLRAEIEPLQYVAFFGALAVFGALEFVVSRSRSPGDRRHRWPPNYGLTILNIVVLGALPVSGVLAADFARRDGIGVLNMVPVDAVSAFVITLLLRSFVSWAIHLAMHKVPLLWRVHRVHHTDRFLDISTTVRFHPVEFLISTPILVGSIVVLGLSPVGLLAYELFDAAMAVFTHANVRLPRRLERIMRFVLVTPEMHRVHHSSWHRETDSNYAATFAVWDHVFGTYRDKSESDLAGMELGLAECQDARANSFVWLLKLPFAPLRIRRTAAGADEPDGEKGGT